MAREVGLEHPRHVRSDENMDRGGTLLRDFDDAHGGVRIGIALGLQCHRRSRRIEKLADGPASLPCRCPA